MAKDAKPAAEPAEQPVGPKRSKKLLIIIISAVLVLMLAAGTGAYLLLKKSDDSSTDDEDATETSHAKKKDKKGKEVHPIFITLEPFTVNLVPETGDQYLQVAISVEVEEPTTEQLVKAHMPRIRNNVTLLLSGKKPSELLAREGKQKLAIELKDSINDVLNSDSNKKEGDLSNSRPVKDVLFTSFIIQ